MGLIQISGYQCERCGHKWISRENSEHIPVVCPKCKSPYWNTPRKNRIKKREVRNIGGGGNKND